MPRVTRKRLPIKTAEASPVAPVLQPETSSGSPEQVVGARLRTPGWRRGIIVSQAVLLGVMVAVAGYFYYQYRQTPEVTQQREITSLIKTVGKIVDLPTTEVPTLATVTNKSKLDDQPFFQRAENGDKILIYRSVSRAFLFRPSTHKLIDITSINIETEVPPVETAAPPAEALPEPLAPVPASPEVAGVTTEGTVAATESLTEVTEADLAKPLRVALYNGSAEVGVTHKREATLQVQFPSIEVVAKTNANKKSYTGDQIIDLTGANAAAARAIADFLNGEVTTLPAEENIGPEDVDILIIVGSQKAVGVDDGSESPPPTQL